MGWIKRERKKRVEREIGGIGVGEGKMVEGLKEVIIKKERMRRRDMGVGEMIGMVKEGMKKKRGRIEGEERRGKEEEEREGRRG
ncbi:hypothetical protein [Mycobacterium tuberculosis]|uniref:hypothetical protein n=1 Tax=Mycobacterium tuberculosis TaxID=1773 RepID=UPI00126017B2|nr:hypothetical protein [Mycobacterium tuberculosis]